jgi:hypothetical protein
MLYDLKNDVKVLKTIVPQTMAGNVNGDSVDRQGFGSMTLVALGDGTAVGTIKIQDSDASGSGFADAAAGDILGTNDNAVNTTDTEITIGYTGSKRYVRAVWTNTTGGEVSACFLGGSPDLKPVSGND